MNISLNVIRYFVEAAKQENFSRAANRLYTAQPNLSKKIAELEKTIGVSLFQRTGRQVHLTPAGRYLYDEWAAALEQIERSIRRARMMEQEQRDTVTLGILEGMSIAPDSARWLEILHERYPDVQLHMERSGMHQLFQDFDAGKYDIVVASEFQGAHSPVRSQCGRRVWETCSGVIAINTRDPMAEHRSLTLPMLSGENFISLSQDESPEGYTQFQEICRRYGFEPHIIRETSSIETLLLYVETGVGVALLSGNTRLTSNPSIRLIPLEDLLFDTVVYWHADPVRPAVQAMIDATER